jgi:hypothetical protein
MNNKKFSATKIHFFQYVPKIKLKYFLRGVILQLIVKINNYHKPARPAPHNAQIGGKLALAPRKPSTNDTDTVQSNDSTVPKGIAEPSAKPSHYECLTIGTR